MIELKKTRITQLFDKKLLLIGLSLLFLLILAEVATTKPSLPINSVETEQEASPKSTNSDEVLPGETYEEDTSAEDVQKIEMQSIPPEQDVAPPDVIEDLVTG